MVRLLAFGIALSSDPSENLNVVLIAYRPTDCTGKGRGQGAELNERESGWGMLFTKFSSEPGSGSELTSATRERRTSGTGGLRWILVVVVIMYGLVTLIHDDKWPMSPTFARLSLPSSLSSTYLLGCCPSLMLYHPLSRPLL